MFEAQCLAGEFFGVEAGMSGEGASCGAPKERSTWRNGYRF
ncbi:hypothetical protein SP21_77 [Salmonella phage 21]|nr:hypothetical protein SP21_77 [Salmonella phage 21]